MVSLKNQMYFSSAILLFILINQCYSQSCGSLDLTAVQGDCSKFYRCSNGVLYTLSCPYGLLFDSRVRVCNFANQVSCQQATVHPTIPPCGTNCGGLTTPSPILNPNNIGCQSSQDLTAVPGDCGRFYRCANNILYTFSYVLLIFFNVFLEIILT